MFVLIKNVSCNLYDTHYSLHFKNTIHEYMDDLLTDVQSTCAQASELTWKPIDTRRVLIGECSEKTKKQFARIIFFI